MIDGGMIVLLLYLTRVYQVISSGFIAIAVLFSNHKLKNVIL